MTAPGSVPYLKWGDPGASYPVLAPSSSIDPCFYLFHPWVSPNSLGKQDPGLKCCRVSICSLPQVSDAHTCTA